MLEEYVKPYLKQYRPYKGGSWCYEDGLIYRGLSLLHAVTGDTYWLDDMRARVDRQIDENGLLVGYNRDDFNIDNIQSGRALLYLHAHTEGDKYLKVAEQLIDQLRNHPRTKSGVYWHKKRYPYQIWLDGLYMGLPFQIEYAQLVGDDALIEDAVQQFQTALKYTYHPPSDLFAHAFDEAGAQYWSDPETGLSASLWSRSLGWLAMAFVDCLDLLGNTVQSQEIRQKADEFLGKIEKFQTDNKVWFQVLDRPDLEGNYEESSASAMFHYAFLLAVRLELPSFANRGAEIEANTREMLSKFLTYSQDEQRLRLRNVCEVAGLGDFGDEKRDGSAEYYISEAIVFDDSKGAGPVFSVLSELAKRSR